MKFEIPVTVIVLGEVKVEAESFEAAKLLAMEMAGETWDRMDLNEVSVPSHLTESMCVARR
jgi:hypothetical protein